MSGNGGASASGPSGSGSSSNVSSSTVTKQPASVTKTISFAEIVKDRNAEVRVTADGLLYAVDLTAVMIGKDNEYSALVLRRLSPDEFDPIKLIGRKIGSSGRHETKLISFKDALQLVMVLPGKIAKETKAQFAAIIQRYMAGEASLHDEIMANAASTSSVAQLARASLQSDGAQAVIPNVSTALDVSQLQVAVGAVMDSTVAPMALQLQEANTLQQQANTLQQQANAINSEQVSCSIVFYS